MEPEPSASASTETVEAAASSATSPTPAGPFLAAKPVTISSPGFWSWALLNTATGAITGPANLATPSDTASMSKAWVAADYGPTETTGVQNSWSLTKMSARDVARQAFVHRPRLNGSR
jgi:hypothetical protein